jgi:hypothetical protein
MDVHPEAQAPYLRRLRIKPLKTKELLDQAREARRLSASVGPSGGQSDGALGDVGVLQ